MMVKLAVNDLASDVWLSANSTRQKVGQFNTTRDVNLIELALGPDMPDGAVVHLARNGNGVATEIKQCATMEKTCELSVDLATGREVLITAVVHSGVENFPVNTIQLPFTDTGLYLVLLYIFLF